MLPTENKMGECRVTEKFSDEVKFEFYGLTDEKDSKLKEDQEHIPLK